MSRVSKRTLPSRDDDPVATAQLLPLGANVRLRGREATGVIVGNSPDIDRFQVQWDDTGMVTHCLKANLEHSARQVKPGRSRSEPVGSDLADKPRPAR